MHFGPSIIQSRRWLLYLSTIQPPTGTSIVSYVVRKYSFIIKTIILALVYYHSSSTKALEVPNLSSKETKSYKTGSHKLFEHSEMDKGKCDVIFKVISTYFG